MQLKTIKQSKMAEVIPRAQQIENVDCDPLVEVGHISVNGGCYSDLDEDIPKPLEAFVLATGKHRAKELSIAESAEIGGVPTGRRKDWVRHRESRPA